MYDLQSVIHADPTMLILIFQKKTLNILFSSIYVNQQVR